MGKWLESTDISNCGLKGDYCLVSFFFIFTPVYCLFKAMIIFLSYYKGIFKGQSLCVTQKKNHEDLGCVQAHELSTRNDFPFCIRSIDYVTNEGASKLLH